MLGKTNCTYTDKQYLIQIKTNNSNDSMHSFTIKLKLVQSLKWSQSRLM